MRMVLLLGLVVVLGSGCFSPDVDVDTSGLRPSAQRSSTRPSSSSTSGSRSAAPADRRLDDLEGDMAKLEKKLADLTDDLDKLEKKLGDLKDDLKDDLKKLEDRVKKVEKKLD